MCRTSEGSSSCFWPTHFVSLEERKPWTVRWLFFQSVFDINRRLIFFKKIFICENFELILAYLVESDKERWILKLAHKHYLVVSTLNCSSNSSLPESWVCSVTNWIVSNESSFQRFIRLIGLNLVVSTFTKQDLLYRHCSYDYFKSVRVLGSTQFYSHMK